MRVLVSCLLSLVIGCNACRAPAPVAARAHDVVPMDAVPAPPLPTVASADATAEPPPSPPPRRSPRNVLIVGDSEACAVGTVAKEVAKEQSPPDSVSVECKGGTVIQYWAGGMHFQYALAAHPKADTVLVFLGTNHYWQKSVPSPKVILDQVAARGLTCVWVGNVAVKGRTWPINGMLRDAVTPTCGYFDAEKVQMQLWDGYHPDRANARLWLREVWAAIPPKYEEIHD